MIPCYRARGAVGTVVQGIVEAAARLAECCDLQVWVVNDACPDASWKEAEAHAWVTVLHHSRNQGVGAATLTGLQAALATGCSVVVKLDADGQHPPHYLLELVPHLLGLPKHRLIIVKGSRYRLPMNTRIVPKDRRVGSLLLEPLARAALGYRGLTDVSNGFLAMPALTARYLLSGSLGTPLQPRYLFESSLLARASALGCGVQEFSMAAHYGPSWRSSMESRRMVVPLAGFWLRTALQRLWQRYALSLNLGSALAAVGLSSIGLALWLYITRVGPEISDRAQVSAGTSAAFTSSASVGLLSLVLFLLYDYASGQSVEALHLQALINDLEQDRP